MLATAVLVGVVTPVKIAVGAVPSSTQVVDASAARAFPAVSVIPELEAFRVST